MSEATWYMGPLGDLRALSCPEIDVTMNQAVFGGMHQGLSGARVKDVTGTRADYAFEFNWLEHEEWAWLDAMNTRLVPGPHYLIDPLKKNRLSVQATMLTRCFLTPEARQYQLSYTSVRDAPTGLFVPARSVRLDAWAGTQTQAPVRFNPTALTPVFPRETVTGSVYVKGAAASSGQLFLNWHGPDGEALTSVSEPYAITSAWQRIRITRQAPAGAAACRLTYMAALPRTTLTFAAPQLEAGSEMTTWTAGGGAPKVLFDTLETTSPRFPLRNCSLVLMEA